MSGQLEVHHNALCTAPVRLNLCCHGPYPQPGHSPREALTLRPILLWQLRSSRSNAKCYCDVYMVTLYSCLLQQQGYVCAEPGRAGREKWHSVRRVGRKDGGYKGEKRRGEKKQRIWDLSLPAWMPPPLWSLGSPSLSSCPKSLLLALYKSWCLFLRELLRVVTVLEVSSASSSSFASRTSLKNLKMELKLIQEVSSCLSVPTCRRHTDTHMHEFTNCFLTPSSAHGYTDIIQDVAPLSIHLLFQQRRYKWTNSIDVQLTTPTMHCISSCKPKALSMRAMTAYDLLVQWESLNMLSKWIPDNQHQCTSLSPAQAFQQTQSYAQWPH